MKEKSSIAPGVRFLLHAYSGLVLFAYLLFRLVAVFNPRFKQQAKDRFLNSEVLAQLAKATPSGRRVLILASSAGEFEQAKPLIDRFQRKKVGVLVVIFSQSGINYLQARKETLLAIKSPLDLLSQWQKLFEAWRPDTTIIVRHELWPAFLVVARSFGPVCIIDATASLNIAKRWLTRKMKASLLRGVSKVYTVARADSVSYQEAFGFPVSRLVIAGDTKYDRVKERLVETAKQTEVLMQKWLPFFQGARTLIIGSAWQRDAEFALSAYRRLFEQGTSWRLVIAPHDISSRMVGWITTVCRETGFEPVRFSEVIEPKPGAPRQVLILDAVGFLAEFYQASEAAFVGGGLHDKVHNVLEPASRGLLLSFGPYYRNSREAIEIVGAGLATVVRTPEDFYQWWTGLDARQAGLNQPLLDFMKQKCGASDLIAGELLKPL